jgi:hypothetical protein
MFGRIFFIGNGVDRGNGRSLERVIVETAPSHVVTDFESE